MSARRRAVCRPGNKSYRLRAPARTVSRVAPATAVLVLRVSVVVGVVLVQMLPVRISVRVLAGRAFPGYRPSLSVFLCPGAGAGAVVLVMAGCCRSSRAVARHGSKCLEPSGGETCSQISRCEASLLVSTQGLQHLGHHGAIE